MAKQLNFFTDPCVCGSGKLLKDCCLAQRVDTKPNGVKTGLSNPKCYARALGDCSTKISREHFFSASILKLWDEAGLATVVGVPAINGGAPTELNIRGIRPKVLCKRHNNCLSGLDSLALKFFEFLLERKPQEQFLLINGYELERWFVKVMCGKGAAGFVANEVGGKLLNWTPPSAWLEILFGNQYVPDDSGLTFLTNTQGTVQYGRLQLQSFFAPNREFSGISVILDQFTFIFTMQHLPPNHHTRHRPAVFQISNGSRIREVHTGWRNETLVGLRVTNNQSESQQGAESKSLDDQAVNDSRKPSLVAALFCEQIDRESSGTLSLCRIATEVTALEQIGPERPFKKTMQLAIFLHGGEFIGSLALRISGKAPTGEKIADKTVEVKFATKQLWHLQEHTLNLTLTTLGTFWFDIHMDNQLLVSVPLKVQPPCLREPEAQYP